MKKIHRYLTWAALSVALYASTARSEDVNILIIGSEYDSTSGYVNGSSSKFSPAGIKSHLQNILSGAGLGTVKVEVEERYSYHTYPSPFWGSARCYNLVSWFHYPFPAGIETETRWPF